MTTQKEQKVKEQEARLKALREELETQIEADLAANPLTPLPTSPLEGGRMKVGGDPSKDLSLKRIVEALLFASSKPLMVNEIKKVVGAGPRARPEQDGFPGAGQPQGVAPTTKQMESILRELKEEYEREDRSFELIEIAGGYQIVTRKVYATWLAKLEFQKKLKQASRSALETLAILAYKQPVTRAEVEELRGVDISGVLSTLVEREFVKIVGKKEVPGRPFLYGTTEKFLEHFGLKSLADLPQIGEIKSMVERAVRKEEMIGAGVSEPTDINVGAGSPRPDLPDDTQAQGEETSPLQTES